MNTNLLIDVTFSSDTATPEAFEAFLERVIDELAQIGIESDVTASLAKYEASFELDVTSADFDVINSAMANLRTALHAADCQTAGWPTGCIIRCVQPQTEAELAPC